MCMARSSCQIFKHFRIFPFASILMGDEAERWATIGDQCWEATARHYQKRISHSRCADLREIARIMVSRQG